MEVLAAAPCAHQREGCAKYFPVRTVSVIKVLCGSAANADSLPPHTKPMGHEPKQTAHTLGSLYFHTVTLIPLFSVRH